MKLLEQSKALISSEKIQSETLDFLEDSVSALIGDPVAAGKIMLSLLRSPFLLQERIFWMKLESFLNGVDTTEEERLKFCAKLTCDGTKKENPYRLVEVINRCDTQRKIEYLISASRCLGAGFIDSNTYFRIVHTVMNCLQEDLEFVIENIDKHTEYEYSNIIQGLLNCGLMYQSVIDCNGNDKYAFTPFADTLDRFSLRYTDVNRYPNPIYDRQKEDITIKKSTEVNVFAKFA